MKYGPCRDDFEIVRHRLDPEGPGGYLYEHPTEEMEALDRIESRMQELEQVLDRLHGETTEGASM